MPRGLPNKVKEHLQKARDSALLAVEIYNKPAVTFKSGGFITLMVIAWTSLFHAYYFKRGIKPFYRKAGKRSFEKIVEKVNGQKIKSHKYWELQKCIDEFYTTDVNNPVRKNLEFFIPLRNMIEHRFLPEVDADIFGECQQLLLNLDEFLENEFTIKYCIRESLSFSLQLFPSQKSLIDAVKKNPKNKPIIDFISKYRNSLDQNIYDSSKYSFKAFLIKVANHESRDTLPIHFIDWNKLSDDEKKGMKNLGLVLIKEKQIAVINFGSLKVQQVVEQVNQKINKHVIDYYSEKGNRYSRTFNSSTHTSCWKKYGIRPLANDAHPEKTNPAYCFFDEPHSDYLYTQSWVNFLVTEIEGNNYQLDFRP